VVITRTIKIDAAIFIRNPAKEKHWDLKKKEPDKKESKSS
jgi:hypothetical protein